MLSSGMLKRKLINFSSRENRNLHSSTAGGGGEREMGETRREMKRDWTDNYTLCGVSWGLVGWKGGCLVGYRLIIRTHNAQARADQGCPPGLQPNVFDQG